MKWELFFIVSFLFIISSCTSYEKKGDQESLKNNWLDAIKLYQNAYNEDPSNPLLPSKIEKAKDNGADYYFAKGIEFVSLEQYDEAIQNFAHSFQLRPRENTKIELEKSKVARIKKMSQHLTQKAIVLFEEKKLTQSQKCLLQALEYVPENTLAKQTLFDVEREKNRVVPLLNVAEELLLGNKWEESSFKYQEILNVWSDNDKAIDGLKQCKRHLDYEKYYQQGEEAIVIKNWNTALSAFEKAAKCILTPEVQQKIQICKPYVQSHDSLEDAKASLNKNMLSRAKIKSEESLSFNSNNIEASELLEKVIKLQEKTEVYKSSIQDSLQKQNWKEAIDFCHKILNIWCDNHEIQKILNHCQKILLEKNNYLIIIHSAIILPFKPMTKEPWDGLPGQIVSDASEIVTKISKLAGPKAFLFTKTSEIIASVSNRLIAKPDCFPIISINGLQYGGILYKVQDELFPVWNIKINLFSVSKTDNSIFSITVYDEDLMNHDIVGNYQMTLGDLVSKEGAQTIVSFNNENGNTNIPSALLGLKISVTKQ